MIKVSITTIEPKRRILYKFDLIPLCSWNIQTGLYWVGLGQQNGPTLKRSNEQKPTEM